MRMALALAFACWFGASFAQLDEAAARVPVDAAGARLPLATAGTVLRWVPDVDEVFFDLPDVSWVRLSVYSPSIDIEVTGDEWYDDRPLEATFEFTGSAGERLAYQRFALAPSGWVTLFDGLAREGRHVLRSQVLGSGKNVYLLRLETEFADVALYGDSVTVNVRRRDWHPALSFRIDTTARCELAMYDGDGDDELEAVLVLPSGARVRPPVSEDLAWSYQPLPRMQGLYTIETRIPPQAYQGTNAVRFELWCAGERVPLPLVPPATLEGPEPGAIMVEIVDLQGRSLDIGYRLEGRYDRLVRLDEDDAYELVAIETRGGVIEGPRSVAFGPEGGYVRFVLDRLALRVPLPLVRAEVVPSLRLPLPSPVVALAPLGDVPLPLVRAEVVPSLRLPLPSPVVALAPLGDVPLPLVRAEVVPSLRLPLPSPVVALAPLGDVPLPLVRAEVVPSLRLPLPSPVVALAPLAPLPQPAVKAMLAPSPAALELGRAVAPTVAPAVAPAALVPCQLAEVRLTVRNVGGLEAAYDLREFVPVGLEPSGAALDDARVLAWSGALDAGGEAVHEYVLQMGAGEDETLVLQADLSWAGDDLRDAGAIHRVLLDTVLTLASGERNLYADDVFEVEARVRNPLDRSLRVWLVPSVSSRVALLDGPTTLELPAGGEAVARFVLEGREAGAAALQLLAYACDPASGDVPAGGPPASVRVTLAPVPELPAPTLSTVVTVDLAARRLPVLDGLALVSRLPDGARYALGSSHVDGERVDDPRQVDDALVFDLAGLAAAQVSYTVVHDDAIVTSDADHSLIARTPHAEVLLGDPDALEVYWRDVRDDVRDDDRNDGYEAVHDGARDDAREDAPPVDHAPRVGPVILAPADASLVRSGRVTHVTVEAELEHEVRLFVNDELVPDDRVGQLVRDAGLGRQTLDYIGVALRAGPNTLRVESERGGSVERDEVVVFLAGAPASIEIAALSPLVAGTVAPLRFEITVADAWGMVPRDSFVTVDVAGGAIASLDADAQQAGHQVAFQDGRGVLELAPFAGPGRFTITAAVGLAEAELTFEVASEARPWIVNGIGSLGVHYRDGLRFGVSGSVFARGAVFGDALLTLAAQAPLGPLGSDGDPYERFPVIGSSGAQSADAQSRHGVFARLERGQDYLQYGDFTADFAGALHSARSYTGLSGAWSHTSGFGVRAYAAYVPVRDLVTGLELPSDGTSAYRLPHAPLLPGTLRLEVIKRDRLDGRLILDDGDPLVRVLVPAADYTVDDVVGVILLTRPLPLSDGAGNRYSLRASYQLTSVDDAPSFAQFGVQASYDVGGVTVRAGVSQETRGVGEFERLAAAGVAVEAGAVTADLDVGFGSDETTGGLGVALGVRYAEGPLRAEAEYRFWSVGYRGGGITDDAQAGHAAKLGVAYALTPEWTLAASGRLHSYTLSTELDLDGRFSAVYQGRGDVQLGDRLIGTRPRAEVGVQADAGGARALGSVALRDVLGLVGSEVRLTHLQGLGVGVSSVSDLSVAYRLSDALEVRLTDRITWGQGHALLLGLQSGFEHAALARLACQSGMASCDLDSALPLGRSTVTAEYEIAGGVSATAGSLRVGLDARYPLTERLRLEGSAAQQVDLGDPARNATVLTAGIAFDGDSLDASARYEVRFTSDGAKQVATLGATGVLATATFGSVQLRYLDDPAAAVRQGFGVSLAGAYRGDRVSLLTHHQGRFGNLQTLGEREFEGDTRVSWTMTPAWELRAGHAYQLLPGDGFVDLWSIGVAAHPWAGGSVGAFGRVLHDWDSRDLAPGLGLEVAQALGCGLYGVAGVNAWSGVGADRGAVFGQPGVYLRVDVVFDENWRCGRLREGEGP